MASLTLSCSESSFTTSFQTKVEMQFRPSTRRFFCHNYLTEPWTSAEEIRSKECHSIKDAINVASAIHKKNLLSTILFVFRNFAQLQCGERGKICKAGCRAAVRAEVTTRTKMQSQSCSRLYVQRVSRGQSQTAVKLGEESLTEKHLSDNSCVGRRYRNKSVSSLNAMGP